MLRKAHLHSCLVVLVCLNGRIEAAAIDKFHREAFPGALRRIPIREDEKRIVLVGGRAAAAADPELTVTGRASLQVSLHAVAAVEAYDIKLSRHKIKVCSKCLKEMNLFLPTIRDHDASRDDVEVLDRPVEKLDFKSRRLVRETDLQCLLSVVDSWKFRERVLALENLIALVAQVAAAEAVGALRDESR